MRAFRSVVLLFAMAAAPLRSQGIIQTVAGTDWVFPLSSLPALEAPIGNISHSVVNANGDLFVADEDNHIVFKIDAAGTLTIVAGNGLRGYSGDGGPATAARLYSSRSVALDRDGTLYIAELGKRIRKVTPDGIISTIAGGRSTVAGGDGGQAIDAGFRGITGIASNGFGTIYVVDQGEHTVRRIRNGVIERVAGSGQPGFSGDDGAATGAMLRFPGMVAVDSQGNLFIADSGNNRIRRVSPAGTIATYAGTGGGHPGGDGGLATAAGLNTPGQVAFDAQENLYIADSGNFRIRRVNRDGVITTVAGGAFGYAGDGGQAVSAALRMPQGVAVDAMGAIYISDTGNSRVRKVLGGTIATIAGNGRFRSFPENSNALDAFLFEPQGVAFDSAGNLYVAEFRGHYIRKISPQGLVTTIAGNGLPSFAGDGGPAVAARFNFARGMTIDASGNLYFAEAGGNKVRKITPAGNISTIAGFAGNALPDFGGDGGQATEARLNSPHAVAVDAQGRVYIADRLNHRIRRIDGNGVITTIAGSGAVGEGRGGYSGDGGAAVDARLNEPRGIAFDRQGNLYFADSGNHRIRRITPEGVISTVIGSGVRGFSGDGGAATSASLRGPEGVLVDSANNIYIADPGNHRIRMVSPDGIIRTVAGTGGLSPEGQGFSGDGGPPANARLNSPGSLALHPVTGILYFSDSENDRVRSILPAETPAFLDPGTPLLSFTGRSAGPRTAQQFVPLAASTGGAPFSVSIEPLAAASWLRATPASGLMPASLAVSADPAALAAGNHEANIVITSPVTLPSSRRVLVRFAVGPADTGRVEISPNEFSFASSSGGLAETRTLVVSNAGGGTLNFRAAASTNAGGQWLSVSPATASATPALHASLQVRANPAGLTPGTYTGRITITNEANNEATAITVTLTVTAIDRTILLSQRGLTFTTVSGGGVAPPQTFGVLNVGRGLMNWTASASTISGSASWLIVSPTGGASTAGSANVPLVEVSIDPRGLAPDEYHGRIRIEAPGAANSPQDVSVVLRVLPPGSDPGPVVRPTGLIFVSRSGGTSPGSQDVLVHNLTATPLLNSATPSTLDPAAWLIAAPLRSTIDPARPTRIVVQPEVRDLAPGVREGSVTLLFSGLKAQNVSVLFVVTPAGGGQSAAKDGQRAADGCTGRRLLPVSTSLGLTFAVAASFPTPVDMRVSDDCGELVSTGSVVVAFSNGDPPLPLVPLGGGRWSGTWVPRNATAGQLSLTISAESAGVRGAATITGTLTANPNPPLVDEGGIVSAASFASRAPLAPGGMISIFGARLAEGLASSSLLPLEMRLSNASVSLGGKPLPLIYASDGQINAVVPYDVTVNTQQQLVVRRGSTYTVPVPMAVAQAQPAVFTVQQNGRGQGYILVNGTIMADASAPAAPGSVVVIYCAGLGAVNPVISAGIAAPNAPLHRTVNQPSVTIGGLPAGVQFAGLVPGFTGLYQINAQVPAGVRPGEAVVVLTVAGQQSPPVTMSVR